MYKEPRITDWLPLTPKEMKKRGWEYADVILITGDAYVDHPAFGAAVIGRLIESRGFNIVILAQPNWQDDLRDFKKFGKPRYFFAITAGNMDSMVNHYTANKRLRSNDNYTAGGKSGFRPDYATKVYAGIVKKLYPEVPVVIGGVEASLRRLTHYDYWSDSLHPSILVDTKADLLIYGLGEKPLVQLLERLKAGENWENLKDIPQTAYCISKEEDIPAVQTWEDYSLYSHERCLKDKLSFAKNFKHIETEANMLKPSKRLIQVTGGVKVVVNPPFEVSSGEEIDAVYDLPYTRLPHPKYKKRGPIPAYEMIKFSLNMHRGCFGGCSFCTISAHQGKFISSRSKESILREVDKITEMPDFKGYISDIGGPSANMYRMQGKDLSICERCLRPSCISPNVCYNLDTSHQNLLDIYRSIDSRPKIKKAFVGSGIRFDLLTSYNKNSDEKDKKEYLEQLMSRHVSGRLKVAPEHTSGATLKVMRKPSFSFFYEFKSLFDTINNKNGLKLQLIPYFISSHPGSTMIDMADLAAQTKELGFRLEQVQDFTPTPMTVATVIYYSGYHPYSLKKVFTAKSVQEKKDQHRFFFWYKPENYHWIRNQLKDKPELWKKLLGKKSTPVKKTKAKPRKDSSKIKRKRR